MPAKARLIYLSPAREDVQSIVQYHVDASGVRSGRKVYQTMRDTIGRLEEFPLLGQLHPDPELAALGYRKLVLTRTYVAIYKILDDTVLVYRIVNGRTDYPKLLK